MRLNEVKIILFSLLIIQILQKTYDKGKNSFKSCISRVISEILKNFLKIEEKLAVSRFFGKSRYSKGPNFLNSKDIELLFFALNQKFYLVSKNTIFLYFL